MRYGPEAKLGRVNNGWHDGPGPMRWDWHYETRDGSAQIVCESCPQAIAPLAPDAAGRGFPWNLEMVKARVADHVLKCHADEIAALTHS